MTGIHKARILRVRDGSAEQAEDALTVEAPLSVVADGKPLSVIMRTPGHDLELVRGFLFAEGVLRLDELATDKAKLRSVDGTQDQVELHMDAALLAARWSEREVISSSACGVCGAASLAVVEELARPIRGNASLSQAMLSDMFAEMRAGQEIFAETGGIHAAALFSLQGRMLCLREDVGRHNAVDKLVGWALAEKRVPLENVALLVSGRVSYEIVHKAVVAGIPIVAAVSAPSSLAVELAERWRMTLIAFARDKGCNVYAHPQRLRV